MDDKVTNYLRNLHVTQLRTLVIKNKIDYNDSDRKNDYIKSLIRNGFKDISDDKVEKTYKFQEERLNSKCRVLGSYQTDSMKRNEHLYKIQSNEDYCQSF